MPVSPLNLRRTPRWLCALLSTDSLKNEAPRQPLAASNGRADGAAVQVVYTPEVTRFIDELPRCARARRTAS